MTYQRPVSATDWWFLAHPRRMPPVIQTVVEGVGTLSAEELTTAVAVASQACPGARLRRRGRMWVDSGQPPPVRVLADTGPVTELAALHRPVPSFCEVLLVDRADSTLVFRTSHAVMDGQGKAMWVADVFRALRGETPLGATSAVTEADAFDRLGIGNAESKPDVWVAAPIARPPLRTRPRTGWARRTVDGYHHGLVAKVAVALRSAYDLDPARLAVAFDLRRHLPGERTTGNLVQTELVDVPAGESWEALHERLLSAMARGQEVSWRLDPNLLRTPLAALRTLIRIMEVGKARYASASVLSHLGRVDLATLSTPAFQATTTYLLPLLAASSPPDVNLVECGGRTELTLTWRAGPGLRARAEAVLDQVAEALSPAAYRVRSATVSAAPKDTVVDRFRSVAAARGDAVALRWPGGQLSFAELDRRSEVVAARLADRGMTRGRVVGLLADRSAAAVVGLWGVLKAGAAYLPLDTAHPDARLAALLADAGAAVCLAQRPHHKRVPDGCEPLILDDLTSDRPQCLVSPGPRPEDLAYLCYTSGSTGTPKGVQIEHRALANYVGWAGRRFGVDETTSFALFSSLAFDLPNTALYTSTLAGAPLVLVPDEPSHLSLRHLLTGSGATALKLTPSHLDLIEQLDLRPAGFRLLVVGGEPLRGEVAAAARRRFGPDCRMFNHYGPTEATVGCVVTEVRAEHERSLVVPIGRPAENCQVFLLDGDRRFVAPGEVGEMHLAGVQLARGYRGEPDLDRFSRLADGTRIYRTGDLAYLDDDGELVFAGRTDEQVKVDGHRVEPAEVARVLESHPAVTRAVVVPRGGVLAAYVTGAGEPAELARHAAERLPRYLVPASIQVVGELPRTRNGKIDVSALPAIPTEARVAPSVDSVQEAVVEIWARLLGVAADRLDGTADFHRLGGSSVLLLSMLAAVSAEVVGPDRERAFMAGLGRIVRRPTVDVVCELARDAAAGRGRQ